MLAMEARIGVRIIRSALRGEVVAFPNLKRMADGAERILSRQKAAAGDRERAIEWMRRMIAEKGRACLAETLGRDKSNLAKMAN
jgi:hypothetical protein